jgi:hypothetical protein
MKKFLPLLIIAAAGIVLVFNSELIGDLEGNTDAIYHIDVAKTTPVEELEAGKLYQMYSEESDTEKIELITETVVGVQGTVVSVGRGSTGDYVVKLKGGVSCSYNNKGKADVKHLKPGNIIRTKGVNIGYSKIKDQVFLVLCELESVH